MTLLKTLIAGTTLAFATFGAMAGPWVTSRVEAISIERHSNGTLTPGYFIHSADWGILGCGSQFIKLEDDKLIEQFERLAYSSPKGHMVSFYVLGCESNINKGLAIKHNVAATQ